MSGIDVQRCEIEKIEKDPLDSKNVLKPDGKSNTVAVELLNDIVENALDSVLTEEGDTRKVCMVGDIVDKFTPRATKLTDLYDIPNDTKNKMKLTSTEEEVKKFIGELSSVPTKGTGDQLVENEEIVPKKKSFSVSTRNFTLEKKTRLTDLVKNSKSFISKFLSNETTSKNTEWEERNEEFVKCIELGQISGIKSVTPSHSEEMIRIPDETGMDNINLKGIRCVEGGHDIPMDNVQKSMTFPIASCSKISPEHVNKEPQKDKKKLGLGTKIVNYIKKKASKKDMTKSDV